MQAEVDHVELERLLAALPSMPLAKLQELWRAHWGWPPTLKSPVLLRQIIAWRLQVKAYGGLDPEVRGWIRGKGLPPQMELNPGSVLTREYRGVLHTVEVTDAGYLYDGVRFRSLTRVAQVITGTHWNGPRFFGLRSRDRE
ncbi:DUF2924 domain-containing protein [Bosea sp. (in: a-proteobacteria)]|uniref:DUF2924 domain-containing protein n=1 Tax=Bosea sp. (in: a-proteobacteria) TaxID=1871050 RepID=UPI00121F7B60|nr:DUF2924 domain-containing protein [Bosea sp. (in: a-proteobacteria)]TAJ27876.1 MAG: DUF2924 domain-containing protein [Bosea sp. (in: a-proteobacteria)]